MAQKSKEKEPCKKEACDIQSCLTKNNFIPQRCLKVIELLQSCCERCNYNSTHCGSLSGLLKTKTMQATTKDNKTIDSNKKIGSSSKPQNVTNA